MAFNTPSYRNSILKLLKVVEENQTEAEDENYSRACEAPEVKPSTRITRHRRNISLSVDLGNANDEHKSSAVSSPEAKTGLHRKNEDWNSLQIAVVGLFQRKKLTNNDLAPLLDNVRTLLNSEAGTFVYEYYQKQLLTRGMIILREEIRQNEGSELIRKLDEVWNYFYSYILPTLEAILMPLTIHLMLETRGMTVRKCTLIGFRDVVLLKINLKSIDAWNEQFSSSLKQMLLVLQGSDDGKMPNSQQLHLEELLCRVIVPYLGLRGLYEGSQEPIISADMTSSRTRNHTESLNRALSRPLSVQFVRR
ncbi:PRR5L (predicted) [Pycnogonum litorale]